VRGLSLLAAIVVLQLIPDLATATPPPRSLPLFAPVAQQEAGLRVMAESMTVDCSGLPDKPCNVRLAQSLRCTQDGRCQTPLIVPTGMKLSLDSPDGQATLTPTLRGPVLTFSGGPTKQVTLTVNGELTAEQLRTSDGLFVPAVKSRHLLLSNYQTEAWTRLQLRPAPPRIRATTYRLTLSVRFPAAWSLATHTGRHLEPHPEGSVERELPNAPSVVHVRAIEPQVSDGPWTGGPVIGLGGMLERKEFRARLGYEFGIPSWLLFGLFVDTNFHSDVVIAPHVVAGLPTLAFLPLSLSVGVGAAIRVTGEPEAGVRFLTTLQLLAVGLNATFDVYPARSGDILETTISALIMF